MMSNKINVPFSPPDIKEEKYRKSPELCEADGSQPDQGPRNLKNKLQNMLEQNGQSV